MYPDVGPSDRRRLLPEMVTSEDDTARRTSLESEASYLQTVTQIPRSLPPSSHATRSPPLSFFDEYEIVCGVPAFPFETNGDASRPFGRVYTVSYDGSCIAFAQNPPDIRYQSISYLNSFLLSSVCNIIDYSTIAEGVDLVSADSFVYLAFWNDSKDELVAITQTGLITFFSISEDSAAHDYEAPNESTPKKLVLTRSYNVDSSFREGGDWQFMARVVGGTMWLAEWTTQGTIAMRVSRVSKQNFHPVKIYNGLRRQPDEVKLSIPGRTVMATFLWMYEPKRNYTFLCHGIEFSSRELYQSPVRISGRCIAQDQYGQFFLFWQVQDDGKIILKLYTKESFQTSHPEPVLTRPLGEGMISVKASFLNQDAWPFDKLERDDVDSPLIFVLGIRSSGIAVLVWDTYSNKVLKETDTKIKGVKISQRSQIEFCVSPNLQWFAIGCWKDGVIGLFSFVSGVQVWSLRLELRNVSSPMFLPFKFDQSSSKLIVNGKRALFIFHPPCLVDKYKLEYKSLSYDLSLDWEVSFSNVDIQYQRLISQRFLFSLLIFNFDLEDDNGRIAIASSWLSSKMAVVVYTEDELSLVMATWEEVFSFAFRDWLKFAMSENNAGNESFQEFKHAFNEIAIEKEVSQSFAARPGKCHVMLYPNKSKTNDSLVLFSLSEGLNAVFIDLDTDLLEFYYLDEEDWYGLSQSKDGMRATCFRDDGVLVIDLEKRLALTKVKYEVGLIPFLYCFRREKNLEPWKGSFREFSGIDESLVWANRAGKYFSSPRVAPDGNSILLGWDTENEKPVFANSMTREGQWAELDRRQSKIVPCWSLDEELDKFAFVEFDNPVRNINAVGVYSRKSGRVKRLDKSEWNPHVVRVVDSIGTRRLLTYDLRWDDKTGYLWLTAIVRNQGKSETFILLPIGPYSTEGCLPCLYMEDYPHQDLTTERLIELESKFGCALHNMPFNGMTNVHLALTHRDVKLIASLSRNACDFEVEIGINVLHGDDMEGFPNLLRIAIQQKNERVVSAILDIVGQQLAPFISSAYSTKECFEDLWKDYYKAFERILKNDQLYWDVANLEVPSDVFTNEAYLCAKVGTCEEIWVWKNSNSAATSEYWKSLHHNTVKDIEKKGDSTQVPACLKIFCIDDVCKMGLNGILRFLLTHDAPSRIYKCSLVKSCITWKWEHIWRNYSKRSFVYYLLFLGVFSAYAILVGLHGYRMQGEGDVKIILGVLLGVVGLLALSLVPQEINQIINYTRDGRKLFPKDRLWGLKYYLGSRWNLVEVVTCVMLLFVIVPLHILSYNSLGFVPYLFVVIAFECICIWLKVWYYAQAFSETGALVLMIENVIRDCVFFLGLAGMVLVAFSIALFILFQRTLQKMPHKGTADWDALEDDEQEAYNMIHSNFRSPQRAMLALFYAMIGTYDVNVYTWSGPLSPFIVFVFVFYLSIQAIVMFNMLIAIMSDTYDRVKSTEEEQLLMGRARFVDACEAAFSANQIDRMEAGIGKYLYTIFPKDDDLSDELKLWQGRVKAIEDNVQKIVTDSQRTIMENMRNDIKQLEENLENNVNTLEENMKRDMNGLEEGMKRDMTKLERNMKGNMTNLENEVKQEMGSLSTNMKQDISTLETRVLGDMNTFEGRVKTDMTQLQDKMKEDVGTLETNMKGDISLLEETMKTDISTLQETVNSDIGNLKDFMTGDIGSLKDSMKGDMTDLGGNMKEDTSGLEKAMKSDIEVLKDDMKSLMSMVETQIQQETTVIKQKLDSFHQTLQEGVTAEEPSTSMFFEELD